PDSISSFLLRYPQDYFKTAVVLAFGLMMFMLIGTDHPKKWQALIYIAVLSIAMDFYLYANGRYGRTHVEIATWFISIMYLCYFIRLSKVSKDRVFAFGLASAMMFIYLINRDSKYINSSTFTTSTYTMSQSSARSVMDTITADKEHMYVLSNEEYYGLMLCYKTLEAIPAGAMDNIFVLSSFAYPSCQEVLSRYNKRNVFASLCDNDVYYVSSYEDDESNVKTILRYIREHYYPRAKVRVVRTIRGVTVYKFSTGNTLPIIHP
ncbi:MAG: hypothetical protein IIZ48_03035, partial [Erysipelotrichales bacterium]|nr:hypothetical protein [Erysipelotrichales bacterium]